MIDRLTDLRALTVMLKAAASSGGEAAGQDLTESALSADAGVTADGPAAKDAMGSLLPTLSKRPFSSREPDSPAPASVGGPSDPAEAAAPVPAPPPIELLKQALRVAIRLEFATVPPYLTALWSIVDQAHPVAKVIRAIAHEEMLHVALLCNFLSALGERPSLTGNVVPRYPSALPGGVHPELEIHLLGYSPEALDIFMEIERPEEPLSIEGEPIPDFPAEDTTIGEFYAAILDLFETILPALDPRHQIVGPFVWFVLTKPEDVREAIGLIMSQGEGARGQPFSRDPRFLAHYYRFKSLALSVELIWDEATKTLKKGKPIEQPSVFTLAAASPLGYTLAAPQPLRDANDRFEASYSQLLRLLEEAWKDGGHKSYVAALEHMFDLTQFAQSMMRIGTPDGRGYCPAFIYRP